MHVPPTCLTQQLRGVNILLYNGCNFTEKCPRLLYPKKHHCLGKSISNRISVARKITQIHVRNDHEKFYVQNWPQTIKTKHNRKLKEKTILK